MLEMTLGKTKYRLDPAAISAIRYRVENGESIVNHLAACRTPSETEGRLLRMVHAMIVGHRPELPELARQARREETFLTQAYRARDALLDQDPRAPSGESGPSDAAFDEYQVLALLTVAGVDVGLIHELPILHLAAVAARVGNLRDPEARQYHEATQDELAALYPPPKRRA